jgi:microcystin-dependent protein
MWSGAIVNIPSGWALCDGTNGTPNLSGKFIVGYDAGDADYSEMLNAGGEKKHVLSVNEMPSHTHPSGIKSNSQDYVDGSASPNNIGTAGGASISTGSTGGGLAHENRPPYLTLAYIMKL